MILVRVATEKEPWFFIGFTKDDLAKMTSGNLARADLSQIGIEGTVCFFAGEDDEALQGLVNEYLSGAKPENVTLN